jgi:hypothetical protein
MNMSHEGTRLSTYQGGATAIILSLAGLVSALIRVAIKTLATLGSVFTFSLVFGYAQATPSTPATYRHAGSCDEAARVAAQESGVPLPILLAITRTETGRTVNGTTYPWPWTVNMEGRGVWFDTRIEALAYVFDHFKTGARSFDVGCFQINYRWHGARFASIEDMFDPLANARYAASFLNSLYEESGDWNVAAGAFHSRTAVHADRYMVRFGSMMEELEPIDTAAFQSSPQAQFAHRTNRFPLLQQGQTSGLASLVPLDSVQGVVPVIDFRYRQGE